AGRLLDLMLGAIGIARPDSYITNILPWRPPGNRSPTDAEIAACLPFIERHIELVSPEIVVLVGGTAAKTMLAAREGIMRLRGRWFTYESVAMVRPIPARAILHPAYLLRSPAQKRETWIDLLAIKRRLAEIPAEH
ncbi:MAG: uracil-DNA glycosylase, partial [Alphaproteobacteria bacterium]